MLLWADSYFCKFRLSRAEILVLRKGILLQIDEVHRFEPTLQDASRDNKSLFKAASKYLREKLAREAGEKVLHLTETERYYINFHNFDTNLFSKITFVTMYSDLESAY